jgi:hypothetical protein
MSKLYVSSNGKLLTILISFIILWFVITLFQNISLKSQLQVLSGQINQTHTTFGFAHGQCNNTVPAIPCDPNLTYLCEEQGKLYSCNSSGWFPFFDIAMAGGNSSSSFSNLLTSFVQPPCETTKIITVRSTAWIAPGMVIYIQGGGYYIVSTVIDATMVTVINPCFTNNTIVGATVPSGGIVTPGGQQGPPGPPGPAGTGSFQFGDCNYTIPNITCNPPMMYLCLEQQILYICNSSGWNVYFQLGAAIPGGNAYSNTIGSFVQPDCYLNVTILVQSSAWISKGMVLYIENGGYYIVQSVIPLIVSNPCFVNNSIAGTIIGNNSLVSPGGQQGPTIFSNGTNSTTEVPTTIWGRSSALGSTGPTSIIFSNAISPDGNSIYVSGVTGGNMFYGNNINTTTGFGLIAKYDKFGTPQWALGKNGSFIRAINTDQNGFVYTGNQASFGNYVGIEKYDSFGILVSNSVSITFNSTFYSLSIHSIVIDLNGDVYITGGFSISSGGQLQTVLIDFGNNVTILILPSSSPKTIPFVAKYNSLLLAQWVKTVSYVGFFTYYNVKVKNGNVYVSGVVSPVAFLTTIDFGDNITFTGTFLSAFPAVVRYNSSGSTIWARVPTPVSGAGGGISGERVGMDIDENENVYFSFTGARQTYDFGNGVIITLPLGGGSCVIGKYNSSGDMQWASTVIGFITPFNCFYTSIKILNNNVYTVGYLGVTNVLANTFQFGNNITLTINNLSPLIAKYDLNTGKVQWVKSVIYQVPTDTIYYSLTGVNNTFYAGGTVPNTYNNNYGNNVFVAGNITSNNLLLIKYQE